MRNLFGIEKEISNIAWILLSKMKNERKVVTIC